MSCASKVVAAKTFSAFSCMRGCPMLLEMGLVSFPPHKMFKALKEVSSGDCT